MLAKYNSLSQTDKFNKIKNDGCSNTLIFDKDSQFKLLITTQPLYDKNKLVFSKSILSGGKSTYIFKDISPNEVIQNITDKSIQNNIPNISSYDYSNIFDESNIENEAGDKKVYSIDYDIMKLNIVNPDKYSKIKGKNLLIKFDLADKESTFILDKNIIYNTFLCILDKKTNEENSIFKNEISFPLEIKKVVKSIQVRLEDLKQKGIKHLNDEIFLPLLVPNMGLIISQNPYFPKIDLETMKTNFNSVVKQKFILKNILLSFNLSLSLENEKIKLDKNPNNSINESENLGKINDSTNEDITSCGSSNNYNSPKISVSEKDPQDNTNKTIPFRKYNSYSINENNNNLNNNSDFINDNYENNNMNYKSYNNYKMINKCPTQIKSKKKSHYTRLNSDNKYNGNVIFLNSSDIFAKTLFNRYQDKSNSTCNLKILIEFLKIKITESIEELTLYKFFNSFSIISSLSLKIPFFKLDGGIIEKTLTPSLKEIKLVIKNAKLVKNLQKKYWQKLSAKSSSTGENFTLNFDGFVIYIVENESLVKITFNENRPYFLTESLNDKLEQLIKISKFIKKINVQKSVIINQSYMSIEWNFINGNNILSASFVSYYLFNSHLLGVLSEIKDKEYNFWLNRIEERLNKKNYPDYNNIILENYNNITNFLNNINR